MSSVCVICKFSPYFCRGDYKMFQKGQLVASAWMDNKVVTVLSTTSQAEATGTVL